METQISRQIPAARPDTLWQEVLTRSVPAGSVGFWKVQMWQMLQGGAIQQQNSSSREYVVDLTLTDEGKTKFAEATQNNVGKQIAIIYDNGVLSAPRVNEAITGGKAQISGMEKC
mgnify:CR=1 FL=1